MNEGQQASEGIEPNMPTGQNLTPNWEIWQSSKDAKWYLHLVGGQGEIELQSTQGFRDASDAERAIGEARRNAVVALVIQVDEERRTKRATDAT